MDTIRIMLGFQTEAGAIRIFFSALSQSGTGEIGSIQLNAGAVSIHSHTPSAFRVVKECAGIAENLKIVVISLLKMQRLIIGLNIPTQSLGKAEIHGRIFYRAAFSRGNAGAVSRGEETGRHG